MGIYYPDLLVSSICWDSDRVKQGSDDTPVTNWSLSSKFILATQIGLDNRNTAPCTFKIQWRNVTDAGSFIDVTNVGEIKWSAVSGTLVDDVPITSVSRRCVANLDMTWQNGIESVNDNLLPSSGLFDLGSDAYSEFQWSLDPSNAHAGDEYEFRLFNITEGASIGDSLCTVTMASSSSSSSSCRSSSSSRSSSLSSSSRSSSLSSSSSRSSSLSSSSSKVPWWMDDFIVKIASISSSSRSHSSSSSSVGSSSSRSSSSCSISVSQSSSSRSSSSQSISLSSSSTSLAIITEQWGENTWNDHNNVTFDVRMDEGVPTSNRDTLDLQSGEDLSAKIHTFWLKFHLTDKLYNAEIISAKLYIWCTAKEGTLGDTALTLFRCVREVVEDEATWNIAKIGTNWAAPGGRGGNYGAEDDSGLDIDVDYEAFGQVPDIDTWYEIDVNINGLVDSWINRSRKEYGIMFLMESDDYDYMTTFTDSEGTDGRRPYLQIQYRGGESYSSSSRSSSSSLSRSDSSSSLSRSSSSRSSSSSSVSSSSVSQSSSSVSQSSSSKSSKSDSSSSSSRSSSLSTSSSYSAVSVSSSSKSGSSSSSVSYYKKTIVTYLCCSKLGKVEYELADDDRIDVDADNARITTWLKVDDGKPVRNKVKAQFGEYFSPSYPTHRKCWAKDYGEADIYAYRMSYRNTPEEEPWDLEDYPRIYYYNPKHCQWIKTEIKVQTKYPHDYPTADLFFNIQPTGGQEVKSTKAEVIPGQGGPRNLQLTQNQIVPGAKMELWWTLWDGSAYSYVQNVASSYYNTNFLTGGEIHKINSNRYGSGVEEVWLPGYFIWSNGHSVPAWGCGWVDYEVGDWVFCTVRPITKDPSQWNEDSRIVEDDVEKMISARDNSYEDHLVIIPMRIGNHGD